MDKCYESEAEVDKMCYKLFKYYWDCLNKLDNNFNKPNKHSYNLILTKKFLFIALRDKASFD